MVAVKTYNIINKENTISKYKVNMTIISIVKNMTIKHLRLNFLLLLYLDLNDLK